MAQESPQMVPVRCRKVKNETKREQYLHNNKESEGGGTTPKMRIKRIQHYECDLVPARPVQEAKKKSKKDKKEKGQANPCGVVGNKYHSKEDGRFTSHDDEDYCSSLWFSCRSGGRRKGKQGSRSTTWIKKPANAGRHSKDEPRKVKCSTNEPIKEKMTQEEQEELIKKETAKLASAVTSKRRPIRIRIGKKSE